MNSKKAKRLRQLVEHLQTKGVIEQSEWAVYGSQTHTKMMPITDDSLSSASPITHDGRIVTQQRQTVTQSTAMLDPACGKSIYKQMKKRATHLHGKTNG